MRTKLFSRAGHSQLLGWSENDFADGRSMYRGLMLPHCILGGEPFNKAANSEPEQMTTAVRRPASEKE
jgi:hypothetical protein